MSSKYLAIGLIVGLFIGLVGGYFVSQIFSSPSPVSEITNPKVFCNAVESGTSSWYKTEKSPVVERYYIDFEEAGPNPQTVNLGVRVKNNNSESLFNIVVEVTYKTSEGQWNTTSRIAIGFLDIEEYKTVKIALSNPYTSVWETHERVYNDPTTEYRNVTAYVLDINDYRMTAYGYAKP
jgi:hypothetical protein